MNEIWRYDYGKENTSNDVVHFFYKYNRIRISANEILDVPFFRPLCPKIGSNVYFHAFFSKTSWFHRKKENIIQFSAIKIPTNFMHLQTKLTSEMYQKIGSSDGK